MKRLILIFVSILSIVFASQATTFIVTTNADNGAGSLRQALQDASGNAVGLPHSIIFSTAMTITINSDLQINAGNHNGITINGFVDGLDGPDVIIRSGGTLNNQMVFNNTVGAKIYGLVFQNLDYGIHLNSATSCVIKGCYFGTNAAGTAIVDGINQAGVYVQGGGTTANNIVGGLLLNLPTGDLTTFLSNSERCIFAGCAQKTNAGAGVRVPALLVRDAGGTLVVNNYFGVDVTGAVKLGNGNQTTKMPLAHSNIYMNNSINSVIDRNVIAGATGSGIHLENWCNNTKIKGNKIGTNATATAAYNVTNAISFSNEAAGVFIQGGTGILIGYDGGTIANERNIISGNGGAKHNNWQQTCDGGFSDYNQFGIYTESLGSSIIKGNYIGTDVTGNSSGVGNVFGNRAGGIKMVTVAGVGGSNSQNNIIGGGATVNDRNIISGNGYLWKANDNTSTCNGGVASPSGMVGGPGLLLQYANTSLNTVSGNYIGLGADGLTALGNNANGIEIQGAASNNIGTPSVPNYICNNTWGIFLQVDFGSPYVPAANNTIAGNVIGLTPTNVALGNGVRTGLTEGGGIGMQMGVNGNKIGTAVTNGGNTISANRIGISIITNSTTAGALAPNGNTMYNNVIGLDPTGTNSFPNTSHGISIQMGSIGTIFPFNNSIGGTGANQPNIISANKESGIYLSNPTAIVAGTANNIVGNKIGTNLAGTSDLGNTLQGIEIVNVSKTTITSNLISGNDQNGISLTGSSTNSIQNNIIGSNAAKTAPIPNTMNGIFLTNGSADNIIGGIAANEPNFIFNNGANGVLVDGATTITNAIHQNSFSCNTLRGIVLSNGGNNNIKTATVLGSPAQLVYTNPNAFATRIEIFVTDGCATCPTDPTRLQGKTFVTSSNIVAGGTFAFTNALTFDPAKFYTAILHQGATITTTAARNTSEFTACYVLCTNPSPGVTGTATLCETTTGNVFTVSPINSGSTYSWTTPTGVTITAGAATSSITVSIGASPITGNISVTETVTGGCVGSGSTTLTIKAKPTAVSAGTAQNLCSATSASLVGSALPSGTTGAWTVLPSGPTFSASTSASTTASGLVAGTNYTFTWAVTNAPCVAVSASAVVNNPIKPTPSITGTTILCEGTPSATFSTISTTNTFVWTVPTGVTISSGAGTASIETSMGAAPITGNIQVTESSSASCSTVATAPLTIKAKPTAVSAGSAQSLCSATSASLVGSALPSGTTGAWTVLPSGPTFSASTSASTTASGLVAGTNYTFTWAVTNAPCAAVSASAIVNNPIKPTPSITGTTILCEGTPSATFSTTSTTNTFVWTTPTGVTISSGAGTASIETSIGAAPITGNIQVTESSSASCSTVATAPLTIKAKPTAVSAGSAQSLCSATSASLVGSALPSGTTGAWTVLPSGPTFSASTSASTTASGLVAGTNYTFTWAVTNAPCAAVSASAVVNNPIKPTPSITGTTILCEGTPSATFSTTSTTNTFVWTTPTGVTISSGAGTASIETSIGAAPITGNIQVTESSSATCSASAIAPLTIKAKPTAVSAGTDQTVCDEASVTLTGSPVVGMSGMWTVVPSAGISFTNATTASTVASGLVGGVNYTFTWSVTNSPCASVTSSVLVANKELPSVSNAGPNQETCNATTVDLVATSPTVGNGNWTASPSTGVTFDNSSLPTAKASGLTAGTSYVFTWSVTNSPCAASTSSMTFKSTNLPAPVISGLSPVCTSAVSTYTVSSSNVGSTYVWDVISGDVTITTSTTADFVDVNSGNSGGIIRVKETNGGCQNLESSKTISIGYSNAVAKAANDTIITCLSDVLLVGNRPLIGRGTGEWSVVLPSSAIVTSISLAKDSANGSNMILGNNYQFVYTISGAQCGLPQTDTVLVINGLENFYIKASGATDTLCVKTNRNLVANAYGGSDDYTYVWTSSDKSFASKVNKSVTTVQPVSQETVYKVYAMDNVNIGCETPADSVTIFSITGQNLYLPNLITPNGDNKNDIFILRDKDTHQDLIQAGSHLEVVNRWGSKVFEADNYDNTWVPTDLTDGMYYYHISTSCGNKEFKSWLQILGNTNN